MGTDSCSQPTDYQSLKMGVYDGVYQLDMSQADPNWAAMHKEMGIPEADTKAMISGGNVHTMTVMRTRMAASPPAPTTPSCPTTTQASLLSLEKSRKWRSPSRALSHGITGAKMNQS